MLVIKTFLECLHNALLTHRYDYLAVKDVSFIQCLDEYSTIRDIINVVNIAIEGNQKNIYRLPIILTKLLLIFKATGQDVNYINVIHFIVDVLIDYDLIPINDELERILIKEILDASLELLATELPKMKKSLLSCFSV